MNKLFQKIKNLTDVFLLPLGDQKPVFVIFSTIMFLLDLWYWEDCYFVIFVYAFVSDIAVCYLCVYILAFLKSVHRCSFYVANIVFHIIMYVNYTLLFFNMLMFDCDKYNDTLVAIYETSYSEIKDFLSFYFYVNLIYFILLLALVFIELFIVKRLSHKGQSVKMFNKSNIVIVLAFFVFSLGTIVRNHTTRKAGCFERLIVESSQFYNDLRVFSCVADANRNIPPVDCSFTSPNIILVIGESFNKHHSSLYGYNKKTNPRLSNTPNISIYDNVIAPLNCTYSVFAQFLTKSSMDLDIDWFNSQLFPCVFKRAGYNVIYWDNETGSCSYVEKPEVDFYSHTNLKKYSDDGAFLEDYKCNGLKYEKSFNNLIIIHLVGQHFDYSARYPIDRRVFSEADYADRTELSDEQKSKVSDYDNATLFNDSIVSEIIDLYKDKEAILFYFSDHGEEIYDFRNFIGRRPLKEDCMEQWMHCNLDIPFLIYTSDKYNSNHPEVVEKIKSAVHKPFEIDDLPHLLFDLAGMKCEWYDPRRSLINDSFDITRRRMVTSMHREKEKFNYDSVCVNPNWQIGW